MQPVGLDQLGRGVPRREASEERPFLAADGEVPDLVCPDGAGFPNTLYGKSSCVEIGGGGRAARRSPCPVTAPAPVPELRAEARRLSFRALTRLRRAEEPELGLRSPSS